MQKLIVVAFFLLSGCQAVTDKINEHNMDMVRSSTQSSELVTAKTAEAEDFDTLLDAPIADKAERNKAQSKLLAKSEVNCSRFIEETHFKRAITTFGYSTYSNIASTAAAIVSGRAGQNLAGVSSVLGFMGDTLNQEMYSGILMPALTREISDQRTAMFKDITARQAKEITDYPYPLAVMDAIRYHNLCSIPFALVGLVNKTNTVQQVDYSAAISNMDSEIEKQSALLKDAALGLSPSERTAVRQQILDLTKRREILTVSLPQAQSTQAKPAVTVDPAGAAVDPIDAPLTADPQ
ncbi:hypothetical protein SAMN05216600_12941 [Pseudomonas cuatrocienegasensis]|uniref:Lipoprotein n=1 Tax=Pseudomonas cuatrocienegasensis TaxID=543360 RepID=A0ABY1BRD2_9PSED|nr:MULTISPECIES: hypothetical protein [Pseudomonas]OEC32937.1 hypothetical protein A7D25_21330 [Pseudomonas sp. 21C1]SER43713.1 hypothetical protein SAMN05216600_12941 [Pseudomonas cuatrocienegasensis]